METPLLPDLPPEACIAIQPAYFLYQAVGQQVLIQGLRQKTGEGLVKEPLQVEYGEDIGAVLGGTEDLFLLRKIELPFIPALTEQRAAQFPGQPTDAALIDRPETKAIESSTIEEMDFPAEPLFVLRRKGHELARPVP